MITLSDPRRIQRTADQWVGAGRRFDQIYRQAAVSVAPRLIKELQRLIRQGEALGPAERPRGQGGSRPEPWYETGWLADHITVWAHGEKIYVGIPHGITESGTNRRASRGEIDATTIAWDLEHGAVVGGRYIPARPVLRPTVLAMRRAMTRLLEAEVARLLMAEVR